MKVDPYWTFPSFILRATPELGETAGTSVEVSSFLATPVEGRSTGTAALPAEDLSFDHPALDKGAGRLRLTEASSV